MPGEKDDSPRADETTSTGGFEALRGTSVTTGIFSDFSDAAVVCDPGAQVIAWNRAAEGLLGWKAKEALGRAASQFLGTALQSVEAAVHLPDGQSRTAALRRRDGSVFPAELTFAGVFAQSGERAAVLVLVRPLSAERLVSAGPESQRLESGRRLAEAYHDMRQPLTTIEYLLQDALTYPDDSASRGTLISISQQVKYLADLATRFLGEYRVARHPVDVGALLRAAAATVQGESVQDCVPVEVAAPEGIIVRADGVELHRAVVNLVDNAIRAAGPAGRVRVSATRVPGMVELRVEDSGPGYGGAESAGGAGSAGPSLGLLITDRVARAHGGRLEWGVSDRLGGAVFRLLLPASKRLP